MITLKIQIMAKIRDPRAKLPKLYVKPHLAP